MFICDRKSRTSCTYFFYLLILEVYVNEAPKSLLRDPNRIDKDTIRARSEKISCDGQDEICNALAELAGTHFHKDTWTRPGGGGGIARVLQDENVF